MSQLEIASLLSFLITALFDIYIVIAAITNREKNITNISKALGIVQSLITKDEVNTTESYTPRPLYKKFED